MPNYSQSDRLLSVTTPLGEDVLLLSGFSGTEELSRLFRYQLDMLSENESISPTDIVGAKVGWRVLDTDGNPRFFHGMVNRFVAGEQNRRGLYRYRVDVVPWLWFLTRSANCKIFQNKTAPEIIQAIFGTFGFTDYQLNLQATYAKRDYCVQYRETAFNFISRLLEQEGIFYFFQHEESKHTLVLADKPTAYYALSDNEVKYSPATADLNHIFSWEHQYEFRSAAWARTDYNFETPSMSLLTNANTVIPANAAQFEIFDYPGEYGKKDAGTLGTKIRMEEEETAYNVVKGSSRCRTFSPGGKFELDHDVAAERGNYVITSIQHEAIDPSYTLDAEAKYTNTFTCIPVPVVFRPVRLTPKPLVQGPQTAVVVGKSGEEIYVDKYGRVKVQFFWDRDGKDDENSSCWIRVAEVWAGKNWGMVFHPRIGQEVVVDFLEGDPDRPLITGRVYNAEQMPPYVLPDFQTQSGVKTRSSKGGGTDNFNEIRFEDLKGSEDIYFHAEKDFHRVVENDDDLKVGHDQTIEIKNDRTETVKEGNESITIERGNRTEEVRLGDESVTIKQGKRTITVESDNQLEVKTGNRVILVNTGNDTHQIKQGNHEVKIDMGNDSLKISMGNQTTKLDLGKSETEAMQSIELKVGQSSVKIDQTGVTIKGMMIKIEGQVQTEVKGLMAQVSGDAMLQLKGGITMIG